MNKNLNERLFYNGILSNGIVNYISDDQIFRQKEVIKEHLTQLRVMVFNYKIQSRDNT